MFLFIDDIYNWVFFNYFYKVIKIDIWEWSDCKK